MTLLAFAPRTKPLPPNHADLDVYLAALRQAATPAHGLESRTLAGVRARLDAQSRPVPRWQVAGWAPVAAAACMVCLLAGGLLVARETARVGLPAPSALAITPVAPQGGGEGFATAAAQHYTPGPVATGHRHGRGTRLSGRVTGAGPAAAHLP